MASSSSKYGLFIPKKASKGTVLKPASANVFGDDSDEETGAAAVNQMVNRESARAKIKKQTQLEIDKALQEDPSVYEYDAIYDNIQAQKVSTDVKEAHKVDRKPKYMVGLLKMAEVRKREEERRIERKVQKEREEEGNMYADKEAFVTSAYKKKMLEQQMEAERERRQAAMEEMLDVTKQKDLSGFYRYLYRETTGTPLTGADNKAEDRVEVKEEPHSDSDNSSSSSSSRDKRSSSGTRRWQTSARQGSRRDNKDEDTPPQSKRSRSPALGSSRHRSRSREKDCRHHRDRQSRSASPSCQRRSDKRRHHSRDRKQRDRSSSHDKDRRSGSDDRSRTGQISKQGERDEEEGSKSKRRCDSSRDEHSPSLDDKERSTPSTSPPARVSSPQMLPARPPDEDLDRDDSLSESESADEATPDRKDKHRDQESESRGGKKEEPAQKSEGRKKEESLQAKYGRKTTEQDVLDARQRFLARKMVRKRAMPVVQPQ